MKRITGTATKLVWITLASACVGESDLEEA